LNNCGWANNYAGDTAAALDCHQRGLALRREIGDVRGEGFALANLAWTQRMRGDYDRAEKLLNQSVQTLASVDDKVLAGWTLIQRALLERERGRYAQAAGVLVEALAAWGAGGHRALLAWTHGVLGAVLLDWGEPERGRELLADSLRLWQELECPWAVAWIRYEQGRWMVGRQNRTADRLLTESLSIRVRIGDQRGAAEAVEALLESEQQRISPEDWIALHSFAATQRRRIQAPAPDAITRRLDELRRARAAALGPSIAGRHGEQGADMTPDEALERLTAGT
jgi:tetratricopeptide (TPR) repeat protein